MNEETIMKYLGSAQYRAFLKRLENQPLDNAEKQALHRLKLKVQKTKTMKEEIEVLEFIKAQMGW